MMFDDYDGSPMSYALAASSILNDPITYKEAMHSPLKKEWLKAMDREVASIEETGTWVEEDAPTGSNIVGCKWVYKTKRDASGNVLKYKARIVATGYSQIQGIDYDETSSPVARLTSLRVMLTLVAVNGMVLHQMDADTAFLNGTLDEVIYMEFPEGYMPKRKSENGLRLKKSLYGLKQASRCWWTLIRTYPEELGFKRLHSDWGSYTRISTTETTYVLVYVDDVLIGSKELQVVEGVKEALRRKWR